MRVKREAPRCNADLGSSSPDELDSYMYQTVGQDAIQFVAQALDVPLYRRTISGKAVEMGSEYGSRQVEGNHGLMGDETEDMFELLSTVKVRNSIRNRCMPQFIKWDPGCPSRRSRCFCRCHSFQLSTCPGGTCVRR